MSEDSNKSKYDWYQNNSFVTITVLLRNLNENDVNIELRSETVSCICKLSDGTHFHLQLNLFKPIIVSQSNWKLTAYKLEIKLKKEEPIQWSNLETIPNVSQNITNSVNSSQSSVESHSVKDNVEEEVEIKDVNKTNTIESKVESKKCLNSSVKNWDKIVEEFEKEEEEINKEMGSVDNLFKQIYEKGGEEVRKAMNKSFTESGGTVLSTNWKEVSQSKVEVKPPDGCELKKWD